jgi:hypothetical protein
MTDPNIKPSDDVHEYFGLSYSTHAVLPRVLLQSMPGPWQKQFVTLMEQFHAAFEHVDRPEAYKVEAAVQCLVNELTDAQMKAIGYTSYQTRVENRDGEGEVVDEWGYDHYRDADGNEVDGQSYVYVPAPDPLPYYNRGRAYVEPRILRYAPARELSDEQLAAAGLEPPELEDEHRLVPVFFEHCERCMGGEHRDCERGICECPDDSHAAARDGA